MSLYMLQFLAYHGARMHGEDNQVLQLMKHQAELDVKVEDAKAGLPSTISLEGLFKTLDHFDKRHVSDTALWSFTQDCGTATPFGCLCSLVHELQLRSRSRSAAGYLTLCSLGLLVFPMHSEEFHIVMRAQNDQEALSELHVHKFSSPCPGCSAREQRDADSTRCPSVTPPVTPPSRVTSSRRMATSTSGRSIACRIQCSTSCTA